MKRTWSEPELRTVPIDDLPADVLSKIIASARCRAATKKQSVAGDLSEHFAVDFTDSNFNICSRSLPGN